MEEPCSVSKRKKRKTRRCLNELRKKSLRTINSSSKNIELGSKVNSNIMKVPEANSTKNFITSSRLTLAIFPKAVRSETITRPLLAEIKHKPGNININNIVKSKRDPDEIVSAEVEEEDVRANGKSDNSSFTFSFDELSADNVEKDRAERDSILLNLESPSLAGSAAASPPSPAPAPASPARAPRDAAAYRLYEQFVKNIPRYIQAHAPSLLEEDAARKPIEILRNIYLEGLERECDGDSRSEREDEARRGRAGDGALSPSPSPSASLSPSPLRIRDTPDYTYFPHRLNE